jgi:uncharacterized protein YkwD
VVRCRIVTNRRLTRRPVLPLLVALLVGSTTAGTATVLAKPLDRVASDQGTLSASYTDAQQSADVNRSSTHRPTGTVTSTKTPTSTTSTTTTATSSTTTSATKPTQTSPSTSTGTPTPAPSAEADQVVTLVNKERLDNDCAPLTVDVHLTAAASAHSADMAQRKYFSHTTPEGTTFDQRIVAAGYASPGAENIARGQKSAESVMEAWMNSSGHRANILNCKLTTIGVGVDTTDKNDWYWTQDFGY